jgi:hypothetical protein
MRTAKAIFAATISALAIVSVAGAASAAELVVNGGFEDIGDAAFQNWGGYTFGAGFTPVLPGWTIVGGSVDVTTNASGWSPAYKGNDSLDINGWTPGEISQTFADEAGQTYTVSFAYSRNAAGAADPAALAQVSAGGVIDPVTATDGQFGSVHTGPGTGMTWKTDSFTFVGTGSDTIDLKALNGTNGGVFFDAISVTGSIPEPATWGLMILGFGGAGAMLRRRRAVAATA